MANEGHAQTKQNLDSKPQKNWHYYKKQVQMLPVFSALIEANIWALMSFFRSKRKEIRFVESFLTKNPLL